MKETEFKVVPKQREKLTAADKGHSSNILLKDKYERLKRKVEERIDKTQFGLGNVPEPEKQHL